MNQNLKLVAVDKIENNVEKKENAGYQQSVQADLC